MLAQLLLYVNKKDRQGNKMPENRDNSPITKTQYFIYQLIKNKKTCPTVWDKAQMTK